MDTSAWVEFDRATGSAVDLQLAALIEAGANIAVTEPVIMEVLAGARTPSLEHDLRRLMASFSLLAFDSISDFNAASTIYLRCRRSGITPRGLVDCMIAAVAWRTGAALLTADRDLAQIAQVLGLPLNT